MGIIPPSVLQVLKDLAKIAVNQLKQLISPKLQHQYDQNLALMRVLTGSAVPVASPVASSINTRNIAFDVPHIDASSISLDIPHKSLTRDLVSAADIEQDPIGKIERDPTIIKDATEISEGPQANEVKALLAAVEKAQAAVTAATENVVGVSDAQVKAAVHTATVALASAMKKLKEAMPVGTRQKLKKAQDEAKKAESASAK